jgi:hypothetical protein
MSTAVNKAATTGRDPNFVERRSADHGPSEGIERRQFGNSHAKLSPDARELAEAIDAYKLRYRRRYITFEEMLQVIKERIGG